MSYESGKKKLFTFDNFFWNEVEDLFLRPVTNQKLEFLTEPT